MIHARRQKLRVMPVAAIWILTSALPLAAQETESGANTERAGHLVLSNPYPRPGEAVDVIYHPVDELKRHPELHLRARLRSTLDDAYNSGMGSATVAILSRRTDGTFSGSVTPPEGAVYAVLAVEDPTATHVDSRLGRFWDVMVADDDGRPSSLALQQRFNDHMGRDMQVVYETALQHTQLHPDDPGAWTALRAAEGWHLGEAAADGVRESHIERVQRMTEQLSAVPELEADIVGSMFWYGLITRHEKARDYWRERLHAEHPGHFFAIQDRFGEAYREHSDDPQTLLPILDELWHRAYDVRGRSRLTRPGFIAARENGDHGAILTWADRYVEADPGGRRFVARLLADDSSTTSLGMTRLRDLVAEADRPDDDARPLGMTAADHHRSTILRGASIRTDLARALHNAGNHNEAIATLDEVMSVGWNTARLRLMAEALGEAGDRERAAEYLAHMAVDPATTSGQADSLRALADVGEGRWNELLDDATRSMYERTLESGLMKPIDRFDFRYADGSHASRDDVMGDAATIIVFWSRNCGPSIQTMPQVARFAESTSADVRVIAVTNDEPEEAEAHVHEQDWDLPRYYDIDGRISRSLNSWGTPQFYVLDGNGHLRFSLTGLSALPRQVAALMAERDGVTGDSGE